MLEVPRHLRRPGDDGYRTPTIEDAERYCQDGVLLFPSQSIREAHTTALGALNDPELRHTWSKSTEDDTAGRSRPNGVAGVDGSKSEKPEYDRNQNLTWKQRIRHLTWAYFTLTMATGGIANVLYNSE
jgi:hypothetical protein